MNTSYIKEYIFNVTKTLIQAYSRPYEISLTSRRTVGCGIVCFAALSLLYNRYRHGTLRTDAAAGSRRLSHIKPQLPHHQHSIEQKDKATEPCPSQVAPSTASKVQTQAMRHVAPRVSDPNVDDKELQRIPPFPVRLTGAQIKKLNRHLIPPERVDKKLLQAFEAAQQDHEKVLRAVEKFVYHEPQFPARTDGLQLGDERLQCVPPFALNIHKQSLLDGQGGSACMQGLRPKMEDFHIAAQFNHQIDHSTSLPVSFIAVFDGHGGNRSASYFAKHIEQDVKKALTHVVLDGGEKEREGLLNALTLLTVERNEKFHKLLNRAREEKNKSLKDTGSTVTLALTIKGHIWAASAGDSRVILVDGDNTIGLSVDHRPDKEKYQREVIRRDGFVLSSNKRNSLVTGRRYMNAVTKQWTCGLTMTRAVGHAEDQTGVNPRSEVIHYLPQDLHSNKFIIACSDGIWDVLSTNDVASIVRKNQNKTPEEIAEVILKHAYCQGSMDNITVVVHRLPNHHYIHDTENQSNVLTTYTGRA